MFVPAKREPAKREFVSMAELVVGKFYHIDSGLGGSWQVYYDGEDGGLHVFKRRAREDWPAATFTYAAEAVPSNVYRLVPESDYERRQDSRL